MGKKTIYAILVLAVLLAALFAVSAYALPDNPPTCSLSSNTYDTTTTAVLTAVSVDTLANAGVASIKFYEDGSRIYTRSCGYATTCVGVKTVVHTTDGSHDYYAVCRDRAGQETRSSTFSIDFEGMNRPPVIDTATPSSPTTMDEDETETFRITAHDPDGDSLSYSWKVDGVTVSGETGTSYAFSRDVAGTSEDFIISAYVNDGNGGVDVTAWTVTVNDLEPEVALSGDDLLTECDTFTFEATVISHDDIALYSWDFGDGTVLTSSDPADAVQTHQFPENGTYEVTVTVMDTDGDTDTDSMSVDVTDIGPEDVDAGDDQTITEGEIAFFNGAASMPCDADDIVSWEWDFGDGNTASGQDVNNTFTDDGTYTVTLTVCDDDGSCVSDTLTVTVEDTEPVADFDYTPTDPIEGDEINFTDTSTSYDGIVSWEWDFDGDGVIDSTDQNPLWTYDLEGDYEVCLTIEEADGDTDTHCETISVGNNAPEIILVANVTSGDEALDVHFDCIVVTGGNAPFDFVIDFGDGSPLEMSDSADHTYTHDGVYNATCTVMDDDGDVAVDDETITVFTVAPDVSLVLNVTSGTEPLDVHADCFAIDGNAPYNYTIDFGDGTVIDSDSADHTYDQNGTFEVICIVEDVDGDLATDSEFVDVLDTVPIIDFDWSPALPEEHENITFTSTIDVYDVPYDVEWDFDEDGVVDSTDENPVFAFTSGGDYNVTLTVTDDDGSVSSVTHSIHVASNPPDADLYIDPLSGDEPLTVDITCDGIGGDAPLSYEIDFGDGTPVSVAAVTTHIFTQNGTYNVTCTVTDIDGDSALDWEVVDVFDTVPIVSFIYTPLDPTEGDTVFFDATIDVYDTPIAIEWDFGDGTIVTDIEDPNHVFDNDGTYPVTITVTDADGSIASFTLDVNVSINAADVMLVTNTTSGYEPLTVEFACLALDGNPPFTFEIDFGDGTAPFDGDYAVHTYDQNGTYSAVCTVTDDDGDVTNDTVVIDVLDTVPSVSFTFDPPTPIEGDVVDFDGTITAYDDPLLTWEWDFDEDGIADSTDEDTFWVYVLEGDYNVTLTATDGDGSVVVAWAVVSVGNNEPFVNLLADPMSGPEGLNVTFNCTVVGGNAPLGFFMDYGDGTTGTDQDSVHQYTSPGSYVATCNVTDNDGDWDSDFVIINVANNAPNVTITGDGLVDYVDTTEGDLVDFECGITDGDAPFAILMDFGDGTSTVDPSEDHAYLVEGLYTASCTVTDIDGDIGYDEMIVNVSNNAPVVNLDTNVTSGLEPVSVEYNCTVGAGNEPFIYLIDFGDGTPTSSSPTGTHDYPTPGTYPMSCTVTDIDGDWDDDTVGIHVIDNPPLVDLVVTPGLAGIEGDSFHFECLVTGGNAPLTYVIDFGDGASTASDSADHTYGLEGIYNATCTVTDSDPIPDVGVDSELIDIANNPPIVNLVTNVTSGLEPLTVEFNCTVGAGNAPFAYVLDFGDGSPTVAVADAVHTYATEGNWDATCTVTDIDGDIGSDLQNIDILNNPPVVDLIAVPSVGLEGMNVSFTCDITGGNDPMGVVLDFGDGTSTTSTTAWHAYPLEGVYNASCIVTDFDGDVGQDWEWIDVANNPPIVNLVTNVSSGLEPLTVEFNCTVGGGNAPFAYVLDFGDGSPTVAVADAVHTYPTEGDFDASCTVTDVDGDVGSDTEHIEVINNPPVVDLIALPSVGLEGVNVSFTCDVTGGNAPLAYVLDFGDGTSTTSPTAWHAYPLEGDYNASCQVIDFDGDVGQDWEWINVSNNPPVVNLATNVTSGFEPLSVNYTCSVGGGNPPLGYVIDFGDGTPTSSSPTGTHDYPLPGDYVMTCTVTDTDGDVDFDTVDIEVLDNVPVVTLTASPSTGPEGVNVSFGCSAVGGNDPLSYVIDFGDGSPVVAADTAWHVFPLEGVFNATCDVTDADFDTGADWTIVNITNNVPVVNLITNVSDGTEPLSVFFNCTLVGGGNPPFAYSIDFGDGTAPVATQTASHTYTSNRTTAYDATCTITDTDGDVSVPDTESIDVYDSEPDTNFTFAPASPIEGDTVVFTDASSAYDGLVAWDWTFGDGNTSTLQNPTNVYGLEGLYLVTLCTTDGDGSSTCHNEWVNVGNNVPVVELTVIPTVGTEPLLVSVTCLVTSGGNAPFTYSVLYGDGDSTTSQISTHTYIQDGLFPVTCMVTDIDGDVAFDMETVDVADTAPIADFNFTPLSPSAGDTVDFTDLSTAYDLPLTWAWDFENDGVIDDTSQNPSHVFPLAGLYIVNLTVTDDDGSVDTAIRSVAVNISTPAPIILGVSAADITNVSANITWSTDQLADSLVEWGLTPALGSSDFDASMVFSHGVLLSGLTPNTTYYYNVTSCNAFADCTTDGPYSFMTLATGGAPGDVTAPVVTLLSPGDTSTDADGNVTVQYSVTDDMADPIACDVYSDTSGAWGVDASQAPANASTSSFDYVGLADSTYTWNVLCDDGTNSDWAAANWTFTVAVPAPFCGDSFLDIGEDCDDGGNVNGDGCSAICVNETCGDGTLQSLFEQCDDGNLINGDGCSDTCAIETIPAGCGDAVIDIGEECDSGSLGGFTCGSLDSFTGGSLSCTPTCSFNTSACTGTPTGVCGDGAINPGESCDGGDWGPVTGCGDFGYTGGALSCSATCGFDTSSCTMTSGTIINSWIYGGWYPNNVEGDVTETTVLTTSMLNSTVQGVPITTIDQANLTYAILTNVSPISNCTVIGTPTNFSVLSDSPCVNVYIDPSTVINSDTTGSSVMDSNITDSDATYSSISNSDIFDSHFSYCTVTNSHLDEVVGYLCTIIDSTVTRSTVDSSTVDGGSTVTDSDIINGSDVTNSDVTGSTVDNSTVTDSTVTDSDLTDSTVTDSTIDDSTVIRSDVDNSTVINSTLVDMIVDDAWIEDDVIYNGTISDDVFYNATENGPANLSDVVNYPPVALIGASATSGTDSLAVNFDASGSSDPNIPGPLNDSLSYAWDFTTDGTTDATTVTASNTFGVGTHTVTLTVTDSFGRTATDTEVITVTAGGSPGPSGGSGGGGSGGGRTGDTYILVLTDAEPTKTLHLKTADTVKYVYNGEDFSFIMRYIYADKAKMGVSKSASYQQYTLDELKKYNLNLDDTPESDISITPGVLYSGAGDFTFSLANAAPKKPIVVLPVGSVDRRTVSVDESNADLEGEPVEVEPVEEETFSEGVLEFVESMSVKSSAPLWAGVGLALLIILLGLGIYFLVVRKEE